MFIKKIVFLAQAVIALHAASVFAQTSSTIEKAQTKQVLTIGYRDVSIPFSFIDDKQQPVGYSVDICREIIQHIKTELNLPDLKTNYVNIASANRIPLLQNGTIDFDCGASTNNLERQKLVAFAPTTFLTGTRWLSKASNNYHTLNDLKGKTVVSIAGTSNMKWLIEYNEAHKLGMKVIPASEHAEAFVMVQSGRAAAFFMDDILLYGLVANASKPADFYVSDTPLTIEPYAIMIRKDDPEFKKMVDKAVTNLMSSGELTKLYQRWFEQPIPPRGVVLNVPMTNILKRIIQQPTDSGDPDDYQP